MRILTTGDLYHFKTLSLLCRGTLASDFRCEGWAYGGYAIASASCHRPKPLAIYDACGLLRIAARTGRLMLKFALDFCRMMA
jgi:hypothetical protein